MIAKRALQVAVMVGSVVPLAAGGSGMLRGPALLGVSGESDVGSHYRYLSGLLFGIGIGFLSCVPRIEEKAARFRLLTFIVLIGGLARAAGWILDGAISPTMKAALVMELAVTPALALLT